MVTRQSYATAKSPQFTWMGSYVRNSNNSKYSSSYKWAFAPTDAIYGHREMSINVTSYDASSYVYCDVTFTRTAGNIYLRPATSLTSYTGHVYEEYTVPFTILSQVLGTASSRITSFAINKTYGWTTKETVSNTFGTKDQAVFVEKFQRSDTSSNSYLSTELERHSARSNFLHPAGGALGYDCFSMRLLSYGALHSFKYYYVDDVTKAYRYTVADMYYGTASSTTSKVYAGLYQGGTQTTTYDTIYG